MTPLEYAVSNGHLTTAEYLRKSKKTLGFDDGTTAHVLALSSQET